MLGGGLYAALRAGVGVAGAWIVVLAAFSALTIVTLAWNPVRLVFGPRPPRMGAPDDYADRFLPAEPDKSH